MLWFVIPMAAISAGTGKLFHYSYPFLAPLALAGGWLVAFIAARFYRWLASPLTAFTRRAIRRCPAGSHQRGARWRSPSLVFSRASCLG